MSLLSALLSALLPRRRRTVLAEATVLPGSPDAVEVGGRFVRVSDTYTTTLAVTGYPAEVGAGWAEPILAYPGLVDLCFHIEPIAPAVAAQRLRKQRGRFESSRRHDAGKGRLDDPELDAAAADAAELAARLARGEARLFRVGMYLTVRGSSPQDLADRVAEVRSLAASLLLDTAPMTWRQLQAWVTSLPLAVDVLGMKRVFDTDALAAAFPFTSPDLPDTVGDSTTDSGMGVLYGLNLHSAGVVVWDRWAQTNYNAVILARSGEGKSTIAKLDLLHNLCLGVQAFVLESEDEYDELAEAAGGVVIRPGAAGVRINPLDLPPGDDDALNDRAQFMQTLLSVMGSGDTAVSAPLPDEQARSLDVAVLAAYRAKGITSDPRTWRRPAPLLADVMAELTNTDPAGRRLAARLHPYVAGSMKGLFDGPTTTVAHGHLVVYALKELPEPMQPVGTLLTLDSIWRTVRAATAPGRRPDVLRMVLVDEAWKLLSTGRGGVFLETLAKSARKYGAGLTVVTQDAADILATKTGRAVVSNAATQILLRQAPQAIDAVTEAFGLTDGERAFLLSCQRGDALLAAGSARVAFHAQVSDFDRTLIATGPVSAGRR